VYAHNYSLKHFEKTSSTSELHSTVVRNVINISNTQIDRKPGTAMLAPRRGLKQNCDFHKKRLYANSSDARRKDLELTGESQFTREIQAVDKLKGISKQILRNHTVTDDFEDEPSQAEEIISMKY
jgi:hypothetical protein